MQGVDGEFEVFSGTARRSWAGFVKTFVNPDVIAQGLSGFDPDAAAIRAGRIMLEHLQDLAAQRSSLARRAKNDARATSPKHEGNRTRYGRVHRASIA